ncbi:MAG: hypothetical protein M3Z24_04865 [Chloroflexota bacterium]|nr:hypothetical protein [Chloroflexota bacterium]
MGQKPHRRNVLYAWLFLCGFLLCAVISCVLGIMLLSTYAHAFTPYLKWQDALLAMLWYITLCSLWGCILTLRFLYALHLGYRREMIKVVDDHTLIVRDLSHKNLSSIFWLIGTTVSCFAAALIGLIPEMLLRWTLQLSPLLLSFVATVILIIIGVAGLVVTITAIGFVVIGWAGSISFSRNMGAPHTYYLTAHAHLAIDNFVLTILYPDSPESMVDLNLLHADDQRHLLFLLRKRWQDAQDARDAATWNPLLGEEIRTALEKAEEHLAAEILEI